MLILYSLIEVLLGEKLVEVFADIGRNFGHADPGVPSHHGLSVWTHQELLKVPLDVTDLQSVPEEPVGGVPKAVSYGRTGSLQKSVHPLLMFTVHIASLKQQEVGNKSIARSNML